MRILTFLCIACTCCLQAQDLAFHYLGTSEGMNTLASWNCAIDGYGYYWIATADGLVRFNGRETTYYYTRTHPELPYDQIGFVFTDSQNRIWVCSDKGLVSIDAHRKLHREVIDPEDPERDITYCFEGGDSIMYAMSHRETFALDPGSTVWRHAEWMDTLMAGRRYRDLRRFDRDKYMLVIPNQGVEVFDTRAKSRWTFIPVPRAHSVARIDSTTLLIGQGGQFGVFSANLFDTTDVRAIPLPEDLADNVIAPVTYMACAADRIIYMATAGDGLISYDPATGLYKQYLHDPANSATIISNNLRYVYADSVGNVLITSVDGVNYTQVPGSTVQYINYFTTPEGPIIDSRVLSIAEDVHRNLWVSMLDDVLILNPTDRTTHRPQLPSQIAEKVRTGIPMNITRDAYNNMWVSWRSAGIGIFKPDGSFIDFLSSEDTTDHIRALSRTRVLRDGNDGYMYIGTESGFYRISHLTRKLDTFPDDPLLRELKTERIVDLLIEKDSWWVSSSPNGAAWCYFPGSKTLKVFRTTNGLSSNRVYGLARGNNGDIYIGSYDGLSILHTDSTITLLQKDKGLVSPRVEALEVADDGAVWITNNYSLLKYTPERNTIQRLGIHEGLGSIDFAIMASAKLASGELAFGTNKGIIIVDPHTMKILNRPLVVYVFYHDQEGREIPCHEIGELTFPLTQNNIRFSFGVNDMIYANQVLYRYRISTGNEAPWSVPSLQNTIDFSPGPGKYIIEVEAFNGTQWYAIRHPILIHIPAPWWRRWWFYICVGVVVCSLLLIYYRYRINRFRKELAVRQQISELESRALRAQMNPHFVFNCLNAIQECVITGRIDEAYMYLSKFSKLLRLVLEHADLPQILLYREIEILELYISLEQLRFKEMLSYDIHVDDNLEADQSVIPNMIIQPHVENAIWHGLRNKAEDRRLTIAFTELSEDYLQVIIEDNGIGRASAAVIRKSATQTGDHRTSKGLAICQQRLDLLKSEYPQSAMHIEDLYHEPGVPKGTRVTVILPILNNS